MRSRLVALGRLLVDLYERSSRDEVHLRAAALAFSTLIAIVPLLATVSIFVARALREDDGRIFELIANLLPYSEQSVVAALRGFMAQAESLSGYAFVGFLVTSLLTFFGVQESLFQIFGVARPPSYWRRLATFSLLLVWGPLLIGFAQTALLVLGQSNPVLARALRGSTLVALFPLVATFVGLTMLYWRAAFRHISLRHAAVGGAAAAAAIELLKLLFGVYVRQWTEVQRAVYGSFAIALFFVLSIQLAWTILLYGAELAAALGARRDEPAAEPAPPRADPWLGMAVLERLAAPGRPTLSLDELAAATGVAAAELETNLAPLVANGLVARAPGAEHASVRLALPPREVRIAAVLAAYRREREASAVSAPAALALRNRLGRAAEFELGEMTLADLLDENATLSAPPPESPSPPPVDLDATRPV